jgi:hypothetical protein
MEKKKDTLNMSRWFNRNGLDTFIEKLTLDNIMKEDEASQVGVGTGCSHAIDKPRSSNRCHRHRWVM